MSKEHKQRKQARRELREKLEGLPAFNAVNTELWTTLSDHMRSFDQPADLIERWARLMQAEIAAGWLVSEIALPSLSEANYGSLPKQEVIVFAVPLLHQTWGERTAADDLVQWYVKLVS